MKVVFGGASKGMGRALARRMATRGDKLFLLGRDVEDLQRSAADLAAGGTAPAGVAHVDLADPTTFDPALANAFSALGSVDTVVITAGMFATQDELENNTQLLRALLDVDFTATVLFCEAARKLLLAHGGGTLAVFSSVAGDRGRKPVILYGAAKAGLSHYLEGLDHKFRRDGLRVITVKPGFVRTGMTAGLKAPPFAGDPADVAARVLRAIDCGDPIVYAPAAWRPIMAAICTLPRFIMRRVGF